MLNSMSPKTFAQVNANKARYHINPPVTREFMVRHLMHTITTLRPRCDNLVDVQATFNLVRAANVCQKRCSEGGCSYALELCV